MSKTERIIIKFDHPEVANAFRQIWNPSLSQFVQHINEMVNRNGTACDLHVEQTAGNEYQFRYKSGSKGVVFVPSDDDIGVKLLDYDAVPVRTKYIVSTPQGFLLMIKTGEVDTKLEFLSGRIEDLKLAIEDYEERIVEARKAELKAREEAEGDSISEPGKADMAINNSDDESQETSEESIGDSTTSPTE